MASSTVDLILGNTDNAQTPAGQQPPRDYDDIYYKPPKKEAETPPASTTTTKTPTTPTGTTTSTGTSSTTTTSTTTSTSTDAPDAKPRLSYVEMFQQMNPYKPKSPEEIEKEKKKQRTKAIFAALGDGISALSNLYFTTQYSPNAYDPKNSLSAKMRERFDKAKKEQEDNDRAYFEGYLRAMQADEAANRDDRNWRHTLERETVTDQRYADEQTYRQGRDKVADDRYAQEQEYRKGRDQVADQRYADEQQHRRDREKVEDKHWQQTYNQNQARINREAKADVVTFALGSGKGTINIPKHALTTHNVSYIFSKLPQNVQDAARQNYGEPIVKEMPAVDANGRQRRGVKENRVVGYKPLDMDAMLIVIGQNIEGNTGVQNAIREIGGKTTEAERQPNPMGDNNQSSNSGRRPNPMS